MKLLLNKWTNVMLGLLCAIFMLCGGVLDVHAGNETLYVNGVDILTASGNIVTCGGGNAVYDAAGHVLTLEDAEIDTVHEMSGIYYRGNSQLTIVLKGDNTITIQNTLAACGIDYSGGSSLIVKGDGSLDITAEAKVAASGITCGASGSLTIDGPIIQMSVSSDPQYETYGGSTAMMTSNKTCTINISNADITIKNGSSGDLQVGIHSNNGITIRNSKIDSSAEGQALGALSGDISISDSTIIATSTGGESNAIIALEGDIRITGDSDVTANGGIGLDLTNRLIVVPADGSQVEYKGGTSKDDAQHVSGSPYTSEFSYHGSGTKELKYSYIHIGRSTDVPEPEDPSQPSQPAQGDHRPCHHRYEWEVTKKATATDDGVMKYCCKYCGKVEYEVPISAYYIFNKDTQEAILKAGQGATVTAQTPLFISFHEMVKNALQERPDVTLVVEYKNAGKFYQMTIPAGSGDQLETLFGEDKFAGFLYLGGAYATTELSADTRFTNVPAELMWFGTTNAH